LTRIYGLKKVSKFPSSDIWDIQQQFRPKGKDKYVVKITTTNTKLIKYLHKQTGNIFSLGFPGDRLQQGWGAHKYHATVKKAKDGIIVTLTRIKRMQHKILKEVKLPIGSNFILEMAMRISVKEHEDLADPKTNPNLVFITQYAFTKKNYYATKFQRGTLNLTLKDGNFYDSKGKLFTAINQDHFIKNLLGGE
jgi:hypothetical protein